MIRSHDLPVQWINMATTWFLFGINKHSILFNFRRLGLLWRIKDDAIKLRPNSTPNLCHLIGLRTEEEEMNFSSRYFLTDNLTKTNADVPFRQHGICYWLIQYCILLSKILSFAFTKKAKQKHKSCFFLGSWCDV